MCEINLKATVEKLDVKPGECLIVTFTDPDRVPNIEEINVVLRESLPEGVKWFYLSGDGIKFSVVKEAQYVLPGRTQGQR